MSSSCHVLLFMSLCVACFFLRGIHLACVLSTWMSTVLSSSSALVTRTYEQLLHVCLQTASDETTSSVYLETCGSVGSGSRLCFSQTAEIKRMKTDSFSSIGASAGGWTLMETFPGRLRSVVHPGGAHDFHTMSQMFSCWQRQLHNIHPSSPATRVLLTPSATSPPVMGDSSPAFPESLEIP